MTHTDECTVTTCFAMDGRVQEAKASEERWFREFPVKLRRGGGFFYGNKSNENYSESV